MLSIIPEINLNWMYTRYPVTFLNYIFFYILIMSRPYRINMWNEFKPKWELALETEED